jgi:hypothetical protein
MLYNIAESSLWDRLKYNLDSPSVVLIVRSLVVVIYVYAMSLQATIDMSDVERRVCTFVPYPYITG